MSLSLGVIETNGLIAAIQAADAACKSATVEIIGYKKVGSGLVSICFAGEISAIKTAIDNGVAAVKQADFVRGKLVIARPEQQVVAQLSRLKGGTVNPTTPVKKTTQPVPVKDEASLPLAIGTQQAVVKVNTSPELKIDVSKKNKNK